MIDTEIFFPYISWERCWWFDLLGLLFLVVFWDRKRPFTMRNLDLVMMCAWVPLGDYEMGPQRIMTALSYLPLLYFWFRLIWLIRRPPGAASAPNLPSRALNALSVLFLAYNIALIFIAPYPFGEVGEKGYNISESSLMGVMGAEQITMEGRPPYGHLPVRGGGAVPYGPSYFLWFVPATAIFGAGDPYNDYAPAARVTTLALLLLSFWLVRRLGRRLGGATAGAALGFAWTVLPYTQSASYWSWTGNLLPGVWALLGLNALLSRRALPIAAAVAGAATTAWLPFAWIPVWFFGVEEGRRRRYLLTALAGSAAVVILAMMQTDGPSRLWVDVTSHLLPGKIPEWRTKWSPFTYHQWAVVIRRVAIVAGPPTGLWILVRLWRARTATVWLLAASTVLLVVHGQLLMSHAPGRMTLWCLPFYLVVFLIGSTSAETRTDDDAPRAAGDHEEKTRALFRAIALKRQGYYDSKPGGPPRLSFWQRRMRRSVERVLDARLRGGTGPRRLLDAGCGRGDFTLELAARYPELEETLGCDFTPELVELAAARAGAQTRVRFQVGDVTALPFEAGRFDATVCLNVLHHIRDDRLDVALDELARVTGRELLLEIKNARSPYFRIHSKRVEGVAIFPAAVEQVRDRLRRRGFALVRRHAIFGLTWLSPLVLLHFERVDALPSEPGSA